VRVQCFPSCRVGVFNINIYRAIERSDSRFVWFGLGINQRRQTFGPGQRRRIDHEWPQVALLVEEIKVRVIVRDDPADVRGDCRPEFSKVAPGHDGIGDLDQRAPVIALRLEVVGAAVMR